jgi:predicted amidophosphoribosyltransferase
MGVELAYAGARSAFLHAGAAKRLVVEFKSGGQPVLAPLMARLAAPAFTELVAAADSGSAGTSPGMAPPARPGALGRALGRAPGAGAAAPAAARLLVTWVPTHPKAQRERGYNQAELLARALAVYMPGLPVAALARKTVRTRHQKALGRAGRQANLRGAFALDEKAVGDLSFRPSALVLVDDVYTTGATTQEVSRVLVAGTGLPVWVFTFSRAVSGGGEGHD